MGSSIIQYEGSTAISQWKEPEQVLAEAKKAAVALKQIMDLKPNKVMFNNEQYLEREDWGTVARFYNCTAKSTETRFVQYGDVSGWEAVAVVIDMRTMAEIGRAESMCLSDEENWGDVPFYEWEDVLDDNGKKIWDQNLRNGKGGYKSRKVQKGSKPKPLFQLRSMAQTRAEAKALKGVFSWVVVLAGYKPTPAEELTGHEDFDHGGGREQKPQVQQPSRASEKQQSAPQGQAAKTTQAAPKTESQQSVIAGEEVLSGIIETVKDGKEGAIWLSLKNGVLTCVGANHIDSDMKPGYFVKFRGVMQKREKLNFFTFLALIELSPVQDGSVAESAVVERESQARAKDAPLAPDAAAVADEMFGNQGGKATTVQSLVDSGQLAPASQVQTATKPGTIGKKKAQRLYAIANQNVKTTGFTEENIKKILAALYPDRTDQHLSELENGKYEWMEKLCTGEEGWADYLPD